MKESKKKQYFILGIALIALVVFSIPKLIPKDMHGDADGNGVIDANDAQYILTLVASGDIHNSAVLLRADMNCNNKLDSGDATIILRIVNNLPITKCWS